MKKLAFFSSLLVTLMVVLGACSKDDTPSPGSEQRAFDVVFSGVNVNAGYQNVTPPSQTKQMADVLSSTNKDKASYVKGAETRTNSCYIAIQELATVSSLEKVTINLMDGQKVAHTYNVSLTAVIGDSGGKDDTASCITFLGNVANYLASKKNITLQVILNGGDTNVSNLQITVHIEAIFSW